MKIGIVCYPTFGGSGVVATELGMQLASRGNDVHFITYERPVRLDRFMSNVYYHEVLPFKYSLFKYTPYETTLAGKMVDVVINEKLDLLHVHYAIPHASVAFLAKCILKSKGIIIPVITTLHGTDITLVGKDPSLKSVVEFSINNSDCVTAVSNFLREATFENFDIKREIDVVYNFIDFDKFQKRDKDHFKKAIAPDGEKILTHISNFRGVKRAEDAIYVFKEVYQEIPCKLLMIGDGPERNKLEKVCRDIGLCHEVRFLGKQGAIEELLSISDLFLLPSSNESFGLAALEAMALHVPVISTNAGGIPEVNVNGVTGYLSEVADVASMAADAKEILRDPVKHQLFRNNAFKKAQEFDVHKIVPEYEAIYQKALDSMN
ncbi:MAG: N-acetyl-alpha-D-glucosaminyl L-malate synthase BshA [Saprospiraceae bacterium]|jgi:N-acetyl-alpha-D-glucosaminyl L-malate synthase BshA